MGNQLSYDSRTFDGYNHTGQQLKRSLHVHPSAEEYGIILKTGIISKTAKDNPVMLQYHCFKHTNNVSSQDGSLENPFLIVRSRSDVMKPHTGRVRFRSRDLWYTLPSLPREGSYKCTVPEGSVYFDFVPYGKPSDPGEPMKSGPFLTIMIIALIFAVISLSVIAAVFALIVIVAFIALKSADSKKRTAFYLFEEEYEKWRQSQLKKEKAL